MKKNLWTRLVAAVLTTAMAFSILAVPASAASGNTWMSGSLVASKEGKIIQWTTEAGFRYMLTKMGEEKYGYSGEKLNTFVENSIAFQKQYAEEYAKDDNDGFGYTAFFYEGDDIPADAYVALSQTSDSTKFWYGEQEYKALDALMDELGEEITPDMVDWSTGTVTFSNGKSVSSMSSGSSDGDVGAILAVVGVTTVAATGVYFYTHPEKWQEVKDYVADLSANVQAKFQEFTDGVKGALGIPTEEAETAETVENAAVPQDAAA